MTLLLSAFAFYFAAGFLFSLAFAIIGAPQLDSHLQGAGLPMRIVIVPGAILLWPLLLYVWVKVRFNR